MTAPNQLPLSSSTPGHSRAGNPRASKCYKTWSWINEERRGSGGSDRGWGLSQGAESPRASTPFTGCSPTSCIPCTGAPVPSLGVNTSKPAKNQVNSTHCHGNKGAGVAARLLSGQPGGFQRDAKISQSSYLHAGFATDPWGETLPGPRDQRHPLSPAPPHWHLLCLSLLFL